MFRQGDVLVTKIDTIPAGAAATSPGHDPVNPFVLGGTVTLALGEVTGHHHSIVSPHVKLFRKLADTVGSGYLAITAQAWLTHQEHDKILLNPGFYRVTRQRQWDSGTIRRVAD